MPKHNSAIQVSGKIKHTATVNGLMFPYNVMYQWIAQQLLTQAVCKHDLYYGFIVGIDGDQAS